MNRLLLKGMASIFMMATLFGNVSCSDSDEEPIAVAVTGVKVDKESVAIKPDAEVTLVATITPSDAANKEVSWTSSNTGVVLVDNTGKVKGVAEGEATVTVKTADGSFAASTKVTVDINAGETGKAVVLSGEIKENITLRSIDQNLLRGFVYVTNGATITIQPGTVVKGEKSSKGTLIVEPGGKIIAEGKANAPIVFTSDQPKGSRNYGDWGGIVLAGKAPVNTGTNPQIEGGPRTTYGGTVTDDNSGILKYVRIEFPGFPLEPNKELNGLTMGGVGSGTTIEYVQVSYCGDDSFEWFGGKVNAKHLIAYKGWDDEFDTDYGYQGKLQFLLGVRDRDRADTSKSNGFESDNDASGSGNSPLTTPVFSNVTLIGPLYGNSVGKADAEILYNTTDAANGAKGGQFQCAMHIRRNSALRVHNSVFTGWPYGLFLDKANSAAAVKNVVFAGMWKEAKDDASASYFLTAGLGNSSFASTNDVIKTNGLYSSVDAAKVAGASFTDAAISDSFFTKVNYKGAFDGTNDWTAGWANWDPQNTDY